MRPAGFAGTSAASAVVTGGAALLAEAGLAAGPASLGDLIRHIATDRGDPGPDNAYGHGEFRLPAPPEPIDATPSTFVPLAAPSRALDTRPESAIGPPHLIGKLAAGDIRDLPIVGRRNEFGGIAFEVPRMCGVGYMAELDRSPSGWVGRASSGYGWGLALDLKAD